MNCFYFMWLFSLIRFARVYFGLQLQLLFSVTSDWKRFYFIFLCCIVPIRVASKCVRNMDGRKGSLIITIRVIYQRTFDTFDVVWPVCEIYSCLPVRLKVHPLAATAATTTMTSIAIVQWLNGPLRTIREAPCRQPYDYLYSTSHKLRVPNSTSFNSCDCFDFYSILISLTSNLICDVSKRNGL